MSSDPPQAPGYHGLSELIAGSRAGAEERVDVLHQVILFIRLSEEASLKGDVGARWC